METGLLALLIEVASIGASSQELKKPISGLVKQFSNKPEPRKAPRTPEERDAAFKKGISVLQSTAKRVNGP